MKRCRIHKWRLVAALGMLGITLAANQSFAEQGDAGEGAQVLTRGPIHEAFAGTITFDPEPGIIVPIAPPDAIEELPPEQKPEGANVAWIPGYWAWDDEREDFLWISGLWRNLPPGRQWVSGYWGASGRGAQWVSGYWADAGLTDAEYLPEPPQSVEAGPNIAAPSADYSWLPGGWVWQQNRYAWRPGFWMPVYPNWVWIPAHYQWAPRGYVYVDGYWDYAIDRRGVLFAPVSFHRSVYSQRGYSYTPSTVINLGALVNHLFLRPNYRHYYFGDYYGANYATTGFLSSFSFHSSRRGYDPIYSRQRWDHRQDRDWERRVQTDFQHRRENEAARPPRTFAAQQELVRKGLREQDQGRVFAQPLDQFTKSTESPLRFQPVTDDDRRRFGRLGQEVRTYRQERQKLETRAVEPAAQQPAPASEPARVRLPRSPVVAKPPDELGKDLAPPKTQALPQPDPKVVPRPRRPTTGQVQPPQRREETRPVRPALQPKPEPPQTKPTPPQAKPTPPKDKPQEKPKQEKPKGEREEKPKEEKPKGKRN